ncbi:hypothetical protein CDD82_7756 [Ophiocordyceps australis]|uniref:Retinoic acid induced 16-like protein n=1 Tax=Ophiocordyceps australis TaxID=1399860 RepID=A0A2C5YNY4_9HYPO|nr:hypothetical protein CDD82_7756 [Ophiocordyceps australis]
MDFWSRLLSPLSSATSRQDEAKDPAKRLLRFEKEYAGLLTRWRNSSNLTRDSDAAEAIEIRLQELTNLLSNESRRPLPHPCIQYASSKQIYVPIGKIATTSLNEWIVKEAVELFATLVESEEEAFVENAAFSSSLTNLLVRITGVNSLGLGLECETRVVELAFNITTKIRLDPDILPAWFKAHNGGGPESSHAQVRQTFAGRTQRGDFPLFYVLMDYIHHEGKVGDFARTGLLYIIEAASSSAALEQWIVESDLSTLMATGLGALYSQLSRKLVIDHLPHSLPPILALSDYQHPPCSYEVVSSCAPQFQSHLETFLSHLLFWQDVLNHCRSVEVKSTLLEHFQVIFLQQLLYPSLLESSDIDGGSSVAVLTYLRRILECLQHPDMINLILHYLLALPDVRRSKEAKSKSSVSDARKRKSMDLATMMAQRTEETATPLLFNLVDLILACLTSRNQQTVNVTLQLVSAILKRHHGYAVLTLLKTELLPPDAGSRRTVGAHDQEVEYLMSLAGLIGGNANFDEIYQGLLKDAMTRLESHPCSLPLISPRLSTDGHKLPDNPPGAPRHVRQHTLGSQDALLNAVLDLLETFFINPVEMNLSITEAIVDLATCGYTGLEGWLARSPKTYTYSDTEDEDDTLGETDGHVDGPPLSASEAKRLKAIEECRRRPEWRLESGPRILGVLQRLCDQIDAYRATVPRFGDLVQQRREAFQAADAMLDNGPAARQSSPALQETPERPSLEEAAASASPARPSTLEGLAQRLLSELGTPSRTGSPRGRKERNKTASGASSPSASLGSTPRGGAAAAAAAASSSSSRVAPREFPINYSEPSKSRVGIMGSVSPGSDAETGNSGGGAGGGEDSSGVSSQAAAFAAIDQSILARRVGLVVADYDLKPIPLDLEPKTRIGDVGGKEGEEEEEEEGEAVVGGEARGGNEETTVSVSHVVTNVIVLQAFLLELAALMQVRASLFGEVRYV